MENCSVSKLKKIEFDASIKPRKFSCGSTETYVSNWIELNIVFVEWLTQQGYLDKSKLPVPNHSKRGKYYINIEKKHKISERDGDWRRVGEFYVDTKYNAKEHVKNILSTIEFLMVENADFTISFQTA